MSIKSGVASFDERGVINLKGYNHSGKSTFERAVAVCLFNFKPNSQAKYIHFGEEYFRIVVSFDDGVSILKDKYINGQGLYEMYKDGKLVYSTKQGNRLTKITAVPKVIEEYLGLINTDMGCLHYQTRRNPLWLVDTKGSENYYSLSEILQIEEISRANALANSDINKLSSDIAELEAEFNRAELLLSEYSKVSESLVVAVSEKELYCQGILSRQTRIEGIRKILENLSQIRDIPTVDCVDDSRLSKAKSLSKTVSEVNSLPSLPTVDVIPSGKLSSIKALSGNLAKIKDIDEFLLGISIDSVNLERYTPLVGLQKKVSELYKVYALSKKLNSAGEELNSTRSKIIEKAREKGVKFTVCSNCGTLLEVNVSDGEN